MSTSLDRERTKNREKRREEQLQDLKQRVLEAERYVEQQKYDNAIQISFDALQTAVKNFGENSIDLLPAYFCLADAYLGQDKHEKAKEFLIAAYWNLLKQQSDQEQKDANPNGEVDEKRSVQRSQISEGRLSDLKSRLHKSFGKLFSAQGRYEEAIKELTQNIYIESLKEGPESITLTPSYYLMGETFSKMKKPDQANAFFSKIVEFWNNKLTDFEEKLRKGETDFMDEIEEIHIENALMTLRKIHSYYEGEYGEQHRIVGECKYSIGMIFKFSGNNGICLEYMRKAYEIFSYVLGDHHQQTLKTLALIQDLEELLQTPSKQGLGQALI